jgi:predicted XRE-type DNA-binding protein
MTELLEFHPIADLFPLIEGAEFDELVADIKANGLANPIMLYEGKILDGRNRYRACLAAGVEPHCIDTFDGYDPYSYVISRNLMRRHLTTQQRAAIAAELATMRHGGDRTSKASNDALTDARAAELMHISEPTVERAKRRLRTDPEAHQLAKAGKLPRAKPSAKTVDGEATPTPKPPKREDLTVAIRAVALALELHQRKLSEWAETVPSFTKRDLASTVSRTRDQLADVEAELSGDYDRKVRRERTLRAALKAVFETDGGATLAEQLGEFWTKHGLAGVRLGESAEPVGQSTEHLATRLNAHLAATGLSQNKFAQAAGVPQPIVSKLVSGKQKGLRAGTMAKIEAALGSAS